MVDERVQKFFNYSLDKHLQGWIKRNFPTGARASAINSRIYETHGRGSPGLIEISFFKDSKTLSLSARKQSISRTIKTAKDKGIVLHRGYVFSTTYSFLFALAVMPYGTPISSIVKNIQGMDASLRAREASIVQSTRARKAAQDLRKELSGKISSTHVQTHLNFAQGAFWTTVMSDSSLDLQRTLSNELIGDLDTREPGKFKYWSGLLKRETSILVGKKQRSTRVIIPKERDFLYPNSLFVGVNATLMKMTLLASHSWMKKHVNMNNIEESAVEKLLNIVTGVAK